jgi:hypothetical protein
MMGLRSFLTFTAGLSCAFSVACGGGGKSSTTTTNPGPTQTIVTSGANVAPIVVNSGPAASVGSPYANGAFATVTVCVPGTSTCQAIDGVLVDTGSTGLRILSSALTSVTLPQQKAASGDPVVECFPFVIGYTWGPVETADVEVASEKASSVPIQVLSDSDYTPPTACSSLGTSSDTLANLGANGIIGVGLFTQDCGSYCEAVQTAPGNINLYYECSSTSSCTPVGESLAQQVLNPVSLFTTDNNGVIIELPAVSGGAPSVSGSLVFGIGTESNNGLAGATVYTADSSGNFTTTCSSPCTGTTGTAPYPGFIDSGSNGYYFLDDTVTGVPPTCSDNMSFYCPSSTVTVTATNEGVNQASGSVSFQVANADTLFSNSADFAYGDLGGTFDTPLSFDFGLPFFFGRNVFTGLQNTTNYLNGYWAY